ncbi:hypothetical protein [Cystobacter fuscus]|uniref:hypothetical protein n=1 Tax=Cystobacter fuscus TaxID=43 RepID=UPI0037BF5538
MLSPRKSFDILARFRELYCRVEVRLRFIQLPLDRADLSAYRTAHTTKGHNHHPSDNLTHLFP